MEVEAGVSDSETSSHGTLREEVDETREGQNWELILISKQYN